MQRRGIFAKQARKTMDTVRRRKIDARRIDEEKKRRTNAEQQGRCF